MWLFVWLIAYFAEGSPDLKTFKVNGGNESTSLDPRSYLWSPLWINTFKKHKICSEEVESFIRPLQIVESGDPVLENMEKVWRTWRT